jgi:membrane fusion protein, multidrug efflux system
MADADPRPPADPIAAEPAVSEKRRRWLRPLLMFGIPLLIAAGVAYFWLTSGRYVATDNAYVQQDVVSISPDVSGRIVEVRVRENQRVRAGDVLFVIDPEPYRLALAQADAQLAAARVQVSTQATDIGGAAADIASANADIELAQSTYDRQAALMKRGFTTRAALDAARHEVTAARARLAEAQASAARARSQLGSGTGNGGSPAAIQAAMAARAKAQYDLARTVVRAPAAGVVSQTGRLQVGSITPSGVPAVSLVRSDNIWIEANYKETDLDHMAVGQPVEIELDAYPDLEVRGQVHSIGAGTGSEFSVLPAQNASGNWVKVTQRVPVRIAIEGRPARPLIAGLSADVTVDTQPGQ